MPSRAADFKSAASAVPPLRRGQRTAAEMRRGSGARCCQDSDIGNVPLIVRSIGVGDPAGGLVGLAHGPVGPAD